MKELKKEHIKKILVIKLKGIGDVVLSTIVLENLRSNFPDVEIDFLTEKPSLDVLRNINEIKNILVLNKDRIKDFINLIIKIRSEKYDLVMDLYTNPKTAQITFASGAKFRAGFPYKGRRYAYNLFGPPERDKFHAADLHLEFLKSIGLDISSKNLLLGLAEEDKIFANNTLADIKKENKMLFCISPSGGWESKKCDPVKFASIAEDIQKKYDCSLFLLWGPGDKNEADEIKEVLKDKITLAPPTTVGQMAAIIAKCDAVIANDSGPMHISTAVGTPTLSMHGPTDPLLQGPYGNKHEWIRLDSLECIGCNLLQCNRNHECFLELPNSLILQKFANLLNKNNLVQVS